MSISKRLNEEDQILQAIQTSLGLLKTVCQSDKVTSIKDEIGYASTPLTTGKRMYGLFKKHGVKSIDQLNTIDPNIFRHKILEANIGNGGRFAKELRQAGIAVVIVPGEFFARGWTQQHYMSLWEQVILRFTKNIFFNNNFHLSNGCVEELLIALSHNKKLFHRQGLRPLNPFEEIHKIRMSIDEIDALGADCQKLYDLYRRISLFLDSDKSIIYREQFSI